MVEKFVSLLHFMFMSLYTHLQNNLASLVSEKDWILPDIGSQVHLDEFVSDTNNVDDQTHQGGDSCTVKL